MHPLGELPVAIAQHLVGLNGPDGGQMLHGLIQRLPFQGAEDHPCSHRSSVHACHTMDVDGTSMLQS